LTATVINPLPAGFVVPAQPVKASKPPVGTDWVHEMKHDGYRIIVRRDGPIVRLYSRNAYDWILDGSTGGDRGCRPSGSRPRASRLTARRLCWDLTACHGSRSYPVGRPLEPQSSVLYAFDLIEHDGEDLRNRPFLDRKAALARLLRETEAGILLNEHIAEDGATVFAHACRLGAEGIVSKKVDGTYQSGPCRVWIKVRNPASIAVQRERSEIWNRRGSNLGPCD
jgi:bifunctional non-homologous end joining protein LigD